MKKHVGRGNLLLVLIMGEILGQDLLSKNRFELFAFVEYNWIRNGYVKNFSHI